MDEATLVGQVVYWSRRDRLGRIAYMEDEFFVQTDGVPPKVNLRVGEQVSFSPRQFANHRIAVNVRPFAESANPVV